MRALVHCTPTYQSAHGI